MNKLTLKFHGTTADITESAIALTHGKMRRLGGVPEHVTIPFNRITRTKHSKPQGMGRGTLEVFTPDYNPTGAGKPNEIVYSEKHQADIDTLRQAIVQRQQTPTPTGQGIDRAAYTAARQQASKPLATFAGWTLTPTTLDAKDQYFNIAGAQAEVEASGDMGKRTTATRVITGGVIFGPAGAVVGGLIRKSRNRIFITVTFPNGDTGLIEAPAKQETEARRFAVAINNAAR